MVYFLITCLGESKTMNKTVLFFVITTVSIAQISRVLPTDRSCFRAEAEKLVAQVDSSFVYVMNEQKEQLLNDIALLIEQRIVGVDATTPSFDTYAAMARYYTGWQKLTPPYARVGDLFFGVISLLPVGSPVTFGGAPTSPAGMSLATPSPVRPARSPFKW